MALLIDVKHPDWLTDEQLRDELLVYYPEADIRVAADPGDLEDIEMIAVSGYHNGEALQYPNLQVIQKTGAGVNNILADVQLPDSIRVARLRTDTSGNEMAEYALAYVLQGQRHPREYQRHQADSSWVAYAPRKAHETRVAVLGLGRIGQMIAERFVLNGFRVGGWSRSLKTIDQVDCFHQEQGLHELLADSSYVVSVLPSTGQTLGMFNRNLFERFNPESVFINVGRGDLVNEPDLIDSLDAGLLTGAVLDVMCEEPLPAESPLWLHPKIQLTPHISGFHLGDAISDIADNYRRLKSGEPLLNEVDRAAGY
ncbi:MAG: NAD(P)-dependent oxidoreductase [Pseudomonadota bacterium]